MTRVHTWHLFCADCGKGMWSSPGSLPQGEARCRECRRATRPEPKPKVVGYGTKSRRTCEVCNQPFRAKMKAQRTCGRACGAKIKARRPARLPDRSEVKWRQCAYCSGWYTTRGCKRCGCEAFQPQGLRTLTCKDCAAPFQYMVKSRHADYCDTCRRLRIKAQRRSGKQRRRAIERGVDAESFNVREIYERDRWRCGLCRRRVNPKLSYPHPMSASLDHVLPIGRGGGHTKANVQLAHLKCNHDKSDGGWQQLALVG